MLSCLYHPTEGMRVFPDSEVEEKLASKVWFTNPKSAEEMRAKYEDEILRNKRGSKQKNRAKGQNDGE